MLVLFAEGCCGNIRIEWHHLIPKTFKGTALVPIHQICHRKIHSVFTERELEKVYHIPELIRAHEEMAKFILWVAKKPAGFYSSSDTANRKR
jgi:hypothetical protein